MPTPAAVLRASLEKHNNTFESLLKLIPPQYYIVNEETEAQVCEIGGEPPRIPLISLFRRHQSIRNTVKSKRHLSRL